MAMCSQRRVHHDAQVQIRINSSLLSRVGDAAGREGVSVSEYMRTLLRRELRDAA